MRLLLDSHILLAVVEGRLDTLNRPIREALSASTVTLIASVVSLWEIAIKVRLGKLPLRGPLRQLPEAVTRFGLVLLDIQATHVLVEAEPAPRTRDPFDRLLLSQCLVENLRLVTVDRALAAHPLAWREP
jgi:PIN domain nuclease of toxin-antitoxin system